MILYGTVWYCMVLYGTVWYCMVLYGTVWYCVVYISCVIVRVRWCVFVIGIPRNSCFHIRMKFNGVMEIGSYYLIDSMSMCV